MSGPTEEKTAFDIAAEDLRVPVSELKLWLMEQVPAPTPVLWSHWTHNRQPIPPQRLLEFMKQRLRLAEGDPTLIGRARATLEALPHLQEDLRRGIEHHLANQVGLLMALGQKIEDLAREVSRLAPAGAAVGLLEGVEYQLRSSLGPLLASAETVERQQEITEIAIRRIGEVVAELESPAAPPNKAKRRQRR